MEKQLVGGIVGLGSLLLLLGGASPAMGGSNNSSADDRPVMEAAGSSSFETEDWTGPAEQEPIVAVKSPSFGTEDWTGSMESSEALGTGAIPEEQSGEQSLDDYNPD